MYHLLKDGQFRSHFARAWRFDFHSGFGQFFSILKIDGFFHFFRTIQTLIELIAFSRMKNLKNGLWKFLILDFSNAIYLLFDERSNVLANGGVCTIEIALQCLVEQGFFFRLFLENRDSYILWFCDSETNFMRLPQFSSHIFFLCRSRNLNAFSPWQNPHVVFANKSKMSTLKSFAVMNGNVGTEFKYGVI